MREQRIIRCLASVLALLALVFAPVYLLLDLAMARLVLFYGLFFAAVGMLAGWIMGKRHPALQILGAAVPAGALAWIAGRAHGLAMPYTVVLVGFGVLLAVWAERLYVTAHAQSLGARVILTPLVAWLCAAFVLYATGRERYDAAQMWPMVIVPAAIWFAVAILVLNRIGLLHAARVGAGVGVPVSVRRSGSMGAAVFIAVTFLFANIGPMVNFIADLLRKLVYWAIVAFAWLGSLFTVGSEGGSNVQGSAQEQMPPMEGEASPLMQLLGTIVMVMILAAVAIAILYGLYKLFPKLWQKLRERLNSLFGSWRDSDDYRDHSERLMTLRQALTGAGKGFRRFVRRFRRRERIADFPTNAGKARFLFREYVRGLIVSGHEPHPAATATEIARPVPSLAKAYNRARYGEEEPEDGEIERAREDAKI